MDIDMQELGKKCRQLKAIFDEAARVASSREEMFAMVKRGANVDRLWDTKELQEDFDVLGFSAPFCIVRRKSDGQEGSLCFSHYPRWYFDFQPKEK